MSCELFFTFLQSGKLSVPSTRTLDCTRKFTVPRCALPSNCSHHPCGVHLAASMSQSVYWLSYGVDEPGFDIQRAQEIRTGFVAYPVSYSQRSEISFPRGRSGRSVRLISFHLVPSSRMSGTPPYAFIARTGVTLHLPCFVRSAWSPHHGYSSSLPTQC